MATLSSGAGSGSKNATPAPRVRARPFARPCMKCTSGRTWARPAGATGTRSAMPLSGSEICSSTNSPRARWSLGARSRWASRQLRWHRLRNAGVEHRSFSFDQLCLITSESNPETGTVAYTLDSDGTCGSGAADLGSLVKRVDNTANVTCYLHDALGRVTTVLYPSGPNHQYTSTKHFQYDAATLSNNAVMQNVKGKLAEAYTGDAHTTELGFSYPNPGASEVDVYQSSTHSNGWYLTTAQHYANGAISALTLPVGVPAITYGLDGEGRPTTVADGSPNGLVKSASYTPDGLTAI